VRNTRTAGADCKLRRYVPTAVDGLLAASALHHELRLVTRNEKDFVYSRTRQALLCLSLTINGIVSEQPM